MNKRYAFLLWLGAIISIGGGLLLLRGETHAQRSDDLSPDQTLHPPIVLRDQAGISVLESGNPTSTMTTCGTCHDTAFIAEHSIHSDGGLQFSSADLVWERPSTSAEMNCFSCHLQNPDNDARLAALADDTAEWASTATLNNTGIVGHDGTSWHYETSAFAPDGTLIAGALSIIEPSDQNCAQCHGVAHGDAQQAMGFDVFDATQWQTTTTGQVFSPQRISNSGMNVADKPDMTRTWDVHAERVVNCVDCHYALNNPIFYQEGATSRPDHLTFDPRRMDFDDYLTRPLHEFANTSRTAQSALADSNRSCTSCHETETTHEWLPYSAGHMDAMACETCHIPAGTANALQFADFTVLTAAHDGVLGYRGVDATSEPPLLTGYEPIILRETDGMLAPYNLVSVWYWAQDGQAIPQAAVIDAYFDDGVYADAVLAAFDRDGDSALSNAELLIETDDQRAVIADRLAAQGYANATIVGDVQAYALHHGVTHGDWAIRDCATCHSEDSRLAGTMELANRTPDDVLPVLQSAGLTVAATTTRQGDTLQLHASAPDDLYIFGRDSVAWVDWVGIGLFVATVLGVTVHGGIRYLLTQRQPAPHDPDLRAVYMYTIYERQWHWLQSAAIFGLIFTGLVIHKPDMFGIFSFRYNVLIHNALALVLVVNAALAAFYHLVSGEIQQYIPRPRGFFGKMFAQAKYYLWGIFRNDPHPFEKTPDSKLNPIQQVTYFGLLNVLLPLQVITGTLMWGAQQFPQWTARLGGLPFLAPFHTLIAWLLATFIVLHVYMTTTGHSPLANIKAMIGGWDDVEIHETHAQEGDKA